MTLSRDVIARAALAVLDERGVEALTVRCIAGRLGVQAASLYNHVRSKDEILDAITELVGQDIDLTSLRDPDWRRGLAAFARSYRSAFRAHPLALAVAARRAVETDAALTLYDSALAALQEAGWDPDKAFKVLAALEYLVLGAALLPFTNGFVRDSRQYADRYPALARSLATADADTTDDAAFELGLSFLLDGLGHALGEMD